MSRILTVNQVISELEIKDCVISDSGGAMIVDALRGHKSLKILDMTKNILGSSFADHFSDALLDNKFLQTVILDDNKIGDAIGKLGKGVKMNTTLHALHLAKNEVADLGLQDFAAGLEGNKGLSYLKLEANEISDIGALELGKSFERNKTISHLSLTGYNSLILQIE